MIALLESSLPFLVHRMGLDGCRVPLAELASVREREFQSFSGEEPTVNIQNFSRSAEFVELIPDC